MSWRILVAVLIAVGYILIRWVWSIGLMYGGINVWGFAILLLGIALILWGCLIWVRKKNRSGWWAMLGLLAPIGLIPIWLLRRKEKAQ